MTTRVQSRFLRTLGQRRGSAAGLLVVGGVGFAAAWLSACGSSSDLSCGKGTEKKGNECVANSSLSAAGGASSEAGTDDTGGGSGSSDGGATGAGGAGGSAGKAADGGDETGVEEITFGGITAAAAANRTPPDATDAVADSIRLSWNPASYPLRPLASIHYELFEADAAGAENFTAPFDTAPAGATSFVVQDRTPGKTYYYVVRAVADEGTAKDTNVVEKSAAPAFDDTPPDFSKGATDAMAAGPTSMTVSWAAATDDQTPAEGIVYQVFWTDKAGGALTLGAVSDPGATSVVVSGLGAAETDYYFRVHAIDAAGNIDDNKVDVRGTTGSDTQAPVFGGCRSVTDVSASTATVTWAPAVDDTTITEKLTYTVYASDVPIKKGQSLLGLEVGSFTGLDPAGKPVTSGHVTGLNASTLYRFVCRAKDAKGNEDTNLVLQTGETSSDGEPPTFAGVVTSVPDSKSIDLTWAEAADNQTLKKDIRYRVYASLTPGNEDFANPIAVSPPGVPGMSVAASNLILVKTTGNVSNTDYYLVVRAADGAGNVDDNKIEVHVTTLVSFADDVQPVFTAKCALAGCHGTQDPDSPPMQGQDLELGAALDNVINVTAREGGSFGEPTIVRVSRAAEGLPLSPPGSSYMYRKITGIGTRTGSTMPPAISVKGPLEDAQKAIIVGWITQGARDN